MPLSRGNEVLESRLLPAGTVVSSIVPQQSPVTTQVQFTVTFNASVTGVNAADFQTVRTGTVAVANPLNVTGSGAIYTVFVSGITGNGSLGLNLVDDGSIHDLANQMLGDGSVSFAPKKTISFSPSYPNSVGIGDFNGDGIPDLAVGFDDVSVISVLLGNGNGTFKAPMNTALGSPARKSIKVANFDLSLEHNTLDLAVTTNFGLSVLNGNGDGTFSAPVNYAEDLSFGFPNQTDSVDVQAVDFSGDLTPDLAVVSKQSDTVTILRNFGPSGFLETQKIFTGDAPISCTLDDFDEDGDRDLAVLTEGNNRVLQVFFNDGFGNFGAPLNLVYLGIRGNVVSLDFNADTHPDLVASAGLSGALSLYLGNGDGTFATPQDVNVPTNVRALAVTDMNGDGITDLVQSEIFFNALKVWLFDGQGNFTASQNFPVGTYPISMSISDLNGDGRPDLVSADEVGRSLSVLLANGAGNFTGQTATVNNDSTPPTATWVAVTSPTNTSVGSATIQFSEPVQNVTPSNFTLNGTNLGSVSGASVTKVGATNNYLISGLAAANASGSPVTTYTLAVKSGNTIQDTAGNALSGTPSVSWVLDKVAPTMASINRATPASQTTTATSLTFLATFNEKVTGVVAARFGLVGTATSGGTIGTPTTGDGGLTWSIPVTGLSSTATGTVQLNLTSNTGVKDLVTNALATSTFSGQAFTLDHTAPTLNSLNIASPSTLLTTATSVTFLATFSEKVTGVAASNFALGGTGIAGGVIGTPTSADGGQRWSVPITGLTGNGTAQLKLANNTGINDVVLNALATTTLNGQTYTLDHAAPTLTSLNLFSPVGPSTTATSVTFLATFSEKVTGVDTNNATDFALAGTAISGGVIGTPTTANGGLTWSIPVTGLSSTANGSVQLKLIHNTGIKDIAGLSLSTATLSGQVYLLDHTAPTLNSLNISSPNTLLTTATSVAFLATFSEKMAGVTKNNFALSGTGIAGGVIGTPTSADGGQRWSIPVTGLTSNGTVQLKLANNTGIIDLATNALVTSTFNGQTYTLDHVAPTLTSLNLLSPVGPSTTATSVTFLATFSEKVTGVNTNVATDFALAGTAISGGVIGTPTTANGGLTWSIPVTGLSSTANGSVQLKLIHNTGIKDIAGLSLSTATFSGQVYLLDHTAPTLNSLNISSPNTLLTTATSVTFLATFSEKMAGVTKNNFALSGTGIAGGVIGTPTSADGGQRWSIPVTGLTSNGTVQLKLANNTGIIDLATNALVTSTFNGQTYTLDHVAPTLTSLNRLSPVGPSTTATSVTFLATFSEKVTGVNTNVATDFALAGTAISGGVIGTPTSANGGLTWSIPVTGLSSTATGTVQLNLTHNTGIKDAAGLLLGTATFSGQTYTLDHTAPTLNSLNISSPNTLLTNATSVTFLGTFSEKVTGVTRNNFALNGTGIAGGVIGNPTSADGGQRWSIPVTGLTGNGTVQLKLANNTGVEDLVTNALVTSSLNGQTYTLDHLAPTLKSINRSFPTTEVTSATSVTFLLTFSEKVTGVNTNAAADFALVGTAIAGGTIGTPTTADGGLTWEITVTNLSSTANGTVQLNLTHNTGIKDLAGNNLSTSTLSGQSYTLSHPAPPPSAALALAHPFDKYWSNLGGELSSAAASLWG